ncbi:MAG TPA: nitroreductase [Chloroflexi bacterium]|jgi:nitroreductase|nr:nitroreductase [Chloroflexota bacterium]
METMQTILERRSIRRYKTDSIPDEDLKQILEAGRQAPSAANRQPWHFVVVRSTEQKQRVAAACNNQMWMADADCILVAVGLPEVTEKWYKVDVAIALQTMVIAARSLGYGTCWIGAFDPERVKAVCGIPANAEVVACTPLGVPDVSPPARERKPWNEVFSADSHGKALEL